MEAISLKCTLQASSPPHPTFFLSNQYLTCPDKNATFVKESLTIFARNGILTMNFVPIVSLLSYLSKEVTRGYVLDHDEERYTTRRQKMYTFMKIPRELEKFMSYGFFHCLVRLLKVKGKK